MKDFIERFHESHERLKHKVHNAWRMPLPKWGQICMGFFYFSIPVVGGYQVMMWAISKSHDSIGVKGEKLHIKEVQGIGDTVSLSGEQVKLGAGHMGGGVKLAVSSKEEQQRNKALLAKVLKRQERILSERER